MTDQRAHQPIEKQVEEALPCDCRFGGTRFEHVPACWINARPAVLALLERREQEHAENIKAAEEASRESAARIVETWVEAGGAKD